MVVKYKSFQELTIDELHDLMRLRSEVFVVEQDCVYQDIDGKDRKALHVLGFYENELAAYSRCFQPGDYFEEAAIGRIVVDERFRDKGLGHQIVDASIEAIQKAYNTSRIKLSAQTYLIDFYTSHGFKATGEEYLEDGIPHIAMIKK